MSQGCNFINTLISASRRRGTSVTPTSPQVNNDTIVRNTLNLSPVNDVLLGSNQISDRRRASSSNNINEDPIASNCLSNKSNSYQSLSMDHSNETFCGSDLEKPINGYQYPVQEAQICNEHYNPNIDNPFMEPLQLDIEDTESQNNLYLNYFSNRCLKSVSESDDILTQYSNVDDTQLENECKELENEVEMWERRVAELERKQFRDDVPRTIVENILKLKKELRDLNVELYKLDLEEEFQSNHDGYCSPMGLPEELILSSDQVSHKNIAYSPQIYLSHQVDHQNPLLNGKFGSHIKPGQENTADILNAVPPTGSLQHKQYLRKASTGTDSTEYSHVPSIFNNVHRHQLPTDHHHRHRQRSRHDDIYVQAHNPDNANDSVHEKSRVSPTRRQMRTSPVRPNHFKGDFRPSHMILSPESSSTASSSSPH